MEQQEDPAIIEMKDSEQRRMDMQMQLNFLQRGDPTVQEILFVSTFTTAYEYVKSTDMVELGIEGSLYLLRCSVAPYYKLRLLNRNNREDLHDIVTDAMKFEQKDNFLAYSTTGKDGLPVRRVLYFHYLEEKTQFLEEVKQCSLKLNQNCERNQIRDTLIRIVSEDSFLDYFISLLKKKDEV